MAEVSKETTKSTEGSVTRGETVRTFSDGTKHVTTFVADKESGLALRASYNVDANGNPSEAHFHGQSAGKSDSKTDSTSKPDKK
jgi:hypothetical protein